MSTIQFNPPPIRPRRSYIHHEAEHPAKLATKLEAQVGNTTAKPELEASPQASAPLTGEPLAVSVKEASHLLGIGRTHLYHQVSKGSLIARKIGSRTVITMASIKTLLNA